MPTFDLIAPARRGIPLSDRQKATIAARAAQELERIESNKRRQRRMKAAFERVQLDALIRENPCTS